MNVSTKSFKLILAGNTNVPAMINSIIRATIQARKDTEDENLTFSQVHVFHTEQSLQSLTASTSWQDALSHYKISSTSLVHHVAKIEDYAMCNFLRKNNGLLAMRLRMLFSRLPKIVGLKKVAHRVRILMLIDFEIL